jgi:hypothetical protein
MKEMINEMELGRMEDAVEGYMVGNCHIDLEKLLEIMQEFLDKYRGVRGSYFVVRVYRGNDLYYDVKRGIFFNTQRSKLINKTTTNEFNFMFPLGSGKIAKNLWNIFIILFYNWIMSESIPKEVSME